MRLSLALAICLALADPSFAQVVTYAITDLGQLGESFSLGNGLNNLRQYVGGGGPQVHIHPLRSILGNPQMRMDLGTLDPQAEGFGSAINGLGQVTGNSGILPSDFPRHAFRSSANGEVVSLTDLGTLGGSGSQSFGYGINDAGQVSGSSMTSGGISRAFRSSANNQAIVLTELGTLGGANSSGRGINAAGQVTGQSTNSSGQDHAFRSTPNAQSLSLTDLGTLGGIASNGIAINDVGQVVGSSDISASSHHHAFRTTPNGSVDMFSDLGTLPFNPDSSANGINNLGVIVGNSSGGVSGGAFVFTSQMYNLNDLVINGAGWYLSDAYAINDLGQIIGVGTIGNQNHAFLLNPVPEPSSMALLCISVAGYCIRRSRRQTSKDREKT